MARKNSLEGPGTGPRWVPPIIFEKKVDAIDLGFIFVYGSHVN
jgi:hypothetical protein